MASNLTSAAICHGLRFSGFIYSESIVDDIKEGFTDDTSCQFQQTAYNWGKGSCYLLRFFETGVV